MRHILALWLVPASAACAASTAFQGPNMTVTPVEVWTGGDDGLTQRLVDAVEDELRKSARFSVGEAGAVPGAVKVVVPTHVLWRKAGRETRVSYRLELERDGRRRGAGGGSCLETELRRCAQQVVRTVGLNVH